MTLIKELAPDWVKPSARALLDKYRKATWKNRALPDFIIIGAQKAGTSSLYNYLGQHPQILPSYEKEVHYFDGGIEPGFDSFAQGEPWYRSHFPLNKEVSAGVKVFEASPLYLFNPLTPKRMHDLLPQVKIIALLRNPTERAISQFFHETRLGRESLPIQTALETEFSRIQAAVDANDYKSDDFICHSYKSRGLYKEQLDRYSQYFHADQMLVLNSEAFFSDPSRALERVFEFVGVDSSYAVSDLKPRNVASNRQAVSPEIYDDLNEFFRPHNEALYALLGENYGW